MELPDKKIVEIKKWEDVRPFAGKVVAYITNNDLYLSQKTIVVGKEKVNYGYISCGFNVWDMRQFGYELYPLVEKLTTVDHRPITDFELKLDLHMRYIELDEIFCIEQAINDCAAFFEHMESKEFFFEVLKNALAKYGLQKKDFQKTKIG